MRDAVVVIIGRDSGHPAISDPASQLPQTPDVDQESRGYLGQLHDKTDGPPPSTK